MENYKTPFCKSSLLGTATFICFYVLSMVAFLLQWWRWIATTKTLLLSGPLLKKFVDHWYRLSQLILVRTLCDVSRHHWHSLINEKIEIQEVGNIPWPQSRWPRVVHGFMVTLGTLVLNSILDKGRLWMRWQLCCFLLNWYVQADLSFHTA